MEIFLEESLCNNFAKFIVIQPLNLHQGKGMKNVLFIQRQEEERKSFLYF